MSDTALITGATSGIGRSFAVALARQGYNLFLTGRREDRLAELSTAIAAEHGVAIEYRIVELTDRQAMLGLVAEVTAMDSITVLVNNAGFGRGSAFHEDDIDAETGMVTVHIETALRLTHAVVPQMKSRGRGRIINVSSLASYLPLPRGAVYASTKAWMVSFSESIALELAPYGIRCQALLPGFTRTDFHRGPQYGDLDRRNRGLIRWMNPDDVVRISLAEVERGRRRGPRGPWGRDRGRRRAESAPKVICVPGAANRLLAFVVRNLPRRVLYRMVAGRRGTGGV
jgi:short-subunit dehydrogenase